MKSEKNRTNTKWATILSVTLYLLLLGGCGQMLFNTDKERNLTISNIAYDVNKKSGYTIYLSENEILTPYLVLTNDYDGNVLLVRKHLLDELKPYKNENQSHVPSYYEGSQIDIYLNDIFFNSLAASIKEKIVDSTVMITDIESIGFEGTDTYSIQRKIFLLSYTETAQEESPVDAVEGTPLRFFKDNIDAVRSTLSSGEYMSWWLRTPDTSSFNIVYGISPDGYVGVCSVGGAEGTYDNGVRPAFCLPKDTVIHKGDVNGEEVYVIQ